MFEKEAEKKSKEIRSISWFKEDDDYCEGYYIGHEEGFQKGAEFGYNKGNKQLTKAKDILRMIVYWTKEQPNNKELSNFINKAEQFISEVENIKEEAEWEEEYERELLKDIQKN